MGNGSPPETGAASGIRASRRRCGGLAALAIAVAVGGCSGGTDTEPLAGYPPFLAFGCAGETRYLAQFTGPDSVRLVAADGIHTLVRIRSASGEKYAGTADTLWTHGQEALLIRGAEIHRGCTATGRQKVLEGLHGDGAVFAATGNEPFWALTVWPDSLVLLLDMGSRRLSQRIAAGNTPTWDDRVPSAYENAAGVAVAVDPGPCLDTMSGEPFPAAVVVRWQDREFRGCGMSLRAP